MYVHTLIKPDGTQETLERKMSFEEAQKIVGGYVQVVKARDAKLCLLVNEDGIMLGLPHNKTATPLVHPQVWCSGIRGNALVVKSKTMR